MRLFTATLATFALLSGLATLTAQTGTKEKGPEKLVLQSKMGNVTFLHAKHVEREKGDCKVCHDKLFPQDAKAPLNFKASMHKPAEAKRVSCGACHVAGGKAFPSMGNCNKCHVKAVAAPAR